MKADSRQRKRVAREAAALLYTSQEKEYKQAKIRAAETCGTKVLPSNLEVVKELDRIAEEREGIARQEQLAQMRRETLQLMKMLENFHTLLVGSVWRGVIHRNSDIDIVTFHSNPEAILRIIRKNGFNVTHTEWCSITKQGKKKMSFHVYITLPSNNQVEIIVRNPEEKGHLGKCEIYGDEVTGLSYRELQRVLKENPTQRFTPV